MHDILSERLQLLEPARKFGHIHTLARQRYREHARPLRPPSRLHHACTQSFVKRSFVLSDLSSMQFPALALQTGNIAKDS